MTRRDLMFGVRAKRHGARHVLKTIEEARRADVPLSWAFALVEQESAFKNIFGGDHGPLKHPTRPPFFRCRVTAKRVQQLVEWVNAGHASNGVGLTQLTDLGLILTAERLGGAHKPRNQLRVGLAHLRERGRGDLARSAWRYNGDPAYQALIGPKQRRWHARLTK